MENEICPFPLRVCFLADTILLAVENILESKQLGGKEKVVIEKAYDFMKTAVQGKSYVDSLTLGENCVEATRSYGVALKALRQLNETGDPSPAFDRYIKLLEGIKQTESNFDDSLSADVQGVKNFFEALRKVSWEKIEKPAEEVVLHGAP